jgi:hypothetical protein
MSADQRQFQRAGVSMAIRYRPARTNGAWRPATLIDIGAGGLRFISPEFCESGAELEFEVVLPLRREAYLLMGAVLWERVITGGGEYGVAFAKMTVDQQAEIAQLVVFLNEKPPR